ncbi:hypothetical protein CPC08DRAFT_186304 [Agrocybe pediades]|nr:hypothetical protein CPC08DRAFT_186304 [Agrocybe pediades]
MNTPHSPPKHAQPHQRTTTHVLYRISRRYPFVPTHSCLLPMLHYVLLYSGEFLAHFYTKRACPRGHFQRRGLKSSLYTTAFPKSPSLIYFPFFSTLFVLFLGLCMSQAVFSLHLPKQCPVGPCFSLWDIRLRREMVKKFYQLTIRACTTVDHLLYR